MTLQEIQDRRNQLAGKIRELATRFDSQPGGWTAEDNANWESVNTDYDSTMAELEAARRGDAVAARLRDIEAQSNLPIANLPRPSGGNGIPVGGRLFEEASPLAGMSPMEIQSQAFQGWFRQETRRPLTALNRAALKAIGGGVTMDHEHGPVFEFRPVNTQFYRQIQSSLAEVHATRRRAILNAALTTTAPTTGGNAIPAETLMSEFEVALLAYGSVRPVARTITTSGGEPLVFASMNDTGNTGRLIAESTLSNDNAGGGAAGDFGPNPVFNKTTWNAFKFTSDTVAFPQELIEDSPFNLLSEVSDALATRIARITESYFATGTGTNEPQGIITGAVTGLTVASATAVTTDELITFQHSVDPSYRMGATWMMHDNLVMAIRKLKDGQNNYIWASGFNGGQPDTLLGDPIQVNQSFPNAMASNAYVMVYGQLNKFYIRRAGSLRMYVLNELYRAKDQVGVVGFLREDSGVMNAGGNPIKRLRNAP